MLALEEAYPNQCFAMMGVHPCSIKADFEAELKIAEEWLGKRNFVAIGEIGTDLYWDKTLIDQQKEAFDIQCGWARQYGLPIVIHCRESMDLTIELVEAIADSKLTGVFHCFTGDADQARRIIELGFFLGIGGVSTFKNGGLDAVLPAIGAERLVLETDSPYLAPVPHRGKRNEPTYIPLIAQRVAELTGLTLEDIAETTTRNANQLFSYRP
jgi:TatD DNase family protein